jgi:hypothetical protein
MHRHARAGFLRQRVSRTMAPADHQPGAAAQAPAAGGRLI